MVRLKNDDMAGNNNRLWKNTLGIACVIMCLILLYLEYLFFVWLFCSKTDNTNNIPIINIRDSTVIVVDSLEIVIPPSEEDLIRDSIIQFTQEDINNWNNSTVADSLEIQMDLPNVVISDSSLQIDSEVQLSYKISDYPLGEYKVAQAFITKRAFDIIIEHLKRTLGEFVTVNKFNIILVGEADACQFQRKHIYDRDDIKDEGYSLNGEGNYMTMTRNSTYSSNDTLAFLRAYDIKKHLYLFDSIGNASPQFNIDLKLNDATDNKGGAFRKVDIRIELEGIRNRLEN